MQLSIDWKFLLMAVAAFGGVIVPVWLWQSDQNARALQLRIVSVSSVQPQERAALKGLKLSLDGQDVNDAHIAVLELANTGSRPLPLPDYEAPVEIKTQPTARVLRAEVSAAVPSDIRPQVSTSGSVISIQPLLLNPKDKIQLTILTDGTPPVFSVRARIAGVPSVEVSSEARSNQPKGLTWLYSVEGFLLFFVFGVTLASGAYGQRYAIGRGAMFVAALISGLGATALLMPLQEAYALSFLQSLSVTEGAAVVAVSVALFVGRIMPRRAP
jgi:hypothetical protein